MVITDHINLMGMNPLIGPNDERFGPRFPDLTNSYAPELQDVVLQEARAMGMQMFRGVYASLTGPSTKRRLKFTWYVRWAPTPLA
jgi:purine-nucleoside phosphorylase